MFNKIPDIYDCIKYDIKHNSSIIPLETAHRIYGIVKNFADCVVVQEYGLTVAEKLEIAKGYVTPLVCKIRKDIEGILNTAIDMEIEDATRMIIQNN